MLVFRDIHFHYKYFLSLSLIELINALIHVSTYVIFVVVIIIIILFSYKFDLLWIITINNVKCVIVKLWMSFSIIINIFIIFIIIYASYKFNLHHFSYYAQLNIFFFTFNDQFILLSITWKVIFHNESRTPTQP